jgi:hypothetical protein
MGAYTQAITQANTTWELWYAWYPVKMHNKWKWLTHIYRIRIPQSYVDYDDWTHYKYGTLFDVIINNTDS